LEFGRSKNQPKNQIQQWLNFDRPANSSTLVKNRLVFSVFVKTGEISLVSSAFCKLSDEFKKNENFEIKNSKKTRGDFKIFDQNRIQKFKIK
jgi:hypothetical protein